MTLNQVIKNRQRRKIKSVRFNPMGAAPQKLGVCLSVFVAKPKKPNSANRKVAKIRLSNGRVISAYIPGEGHNIQEHSYVLVRGGKVQDLPGLRFKIVRGTRDVLGVANRKSSRSRYGVKHET